MQNSMKGESIPTGHQTLTVIEAANGWNAINLRQLWDYRELLWFLTLRNIQLRYKQTVVGAGWAILQPLALMAVYSIFLGGLLNVPTGGIPYPLFVFCGLLVWTYFSTSMTIAAQSLIANQTLVTKVYFPRVLIPLSGVLTGLLDVVATFLVLLIMLPIFGQPLTWGLLLSPIFVGLAALAAFGVGLWLGATNVRFRDIQHVLPLITQIWFFSTPISYPSDLLGNGLGRLLYSLNPMYGVIEGFRAAVLGTPMPPWWSLAVSTVVVLIFVVSGLFYFVRVEPTFAEVI